MFNVNNHAVTDLTEDSWRFLPDLDSFKTVREKDGFLVGVKFGSPHLLQKHEDGYRVLREAKIDSKLITGAASICKALDIKRF